MEYKDYYKILGVDRSASQQDIRKAFRRLARQYHPDVNRNNKDAEARFKEINEANEVLGNPEKRKRYDELGSRWKDYEQWQRAQGAAGAAGGQPFDWSWSGGSGAQGAPGGGTRYTHRTTGGEDFPHDLFGGGGGFSEFFQTFFGRGGETPRTRRSGARAQAHGQDVEHEVEITFEEAYAGTTRVLDLSDASGQRRRLEVKIPAGVRDGSRVRVAGQGAPGAGGGPSGDLFLITRLLPHGRFERRGDDLHERVTIPLTTAVLGGEAEIPTIRGRVMLTVPAGTQDGRVFRLRGQGMPSLDRPGERGDLLAEVHVSLPTSLSARERELFEDLRREDAARTDGYRARAS